MEPILIRSDEEGNYQADFAGLVCLIKNNKLKNNTSVVCTNNFQEYILNIYEDGNFSLLDENENPLQLNSENLSSHFIVSKTEPVEESISFQKITKEEALFFIISNIDVFYGKEKIKINTAETDTPFELFDGEWFVSLQKGQKKEDIFKDNHFLSSNNNSYSKEFYTEDEDAYLEEVSSLINRKMIEFLFENKDEVNEFLDFIDYDDFL